VAKRSKQSERSGEVCKVRLPSNRGTLFGVSLLFCSTILAQATFPLLINAGGPAIGAYTADQFFSGGTTWGPSNDPAMGMQTDAYQTLRYAPSFTYTIPVTSGGLYSVSLLMLEPNKTGAGQRVFTATVNGQQSAAIDLFALTGGQLIPYEVDFVLFEIEKQITISFRASVGNALVSAIIIRGGGQPITAFLALLASVPWMSDWFTDTSQPILCVPVTVSVDGTPATLQTCLTPDGQAAWLAEPQNAVMLAALTLDQDADPGLLQLPPSPD
jgi:hypothetical protein